MLGWLLQQRQARHLTMELLKAVEGLLRATAADPALQRKVIFDSRLYWKPVNCKFCPSGDELLKAVKGLLRATRPDPCYSRRCQQQPPPLHHISAQTHGPIAGLLGLVNGRVSAWPPCNSSQHADLSKPCSKFLVQPSKAVTPLLS